MSNLNSRKIKIYNRLEGNSCICNKKELFLNLDSYYQSTGEVLEENIPLTFLIKNGCDDKNIHKIQSLEV